MIDLKPCPFCGESDPLSEVLQQRTRHAIWWEVECGFCRANGPHGESHDEAIEAWNERLAKEGGEWLGERVR